MRADRPDGQGSGPDPKSEQMKALVENARNEHTTIEIDALKKQLASSNAPLLLDIRDEETFQRQHVSGAVNIPTALLPES